MQTELQVGSRARRALDPLALWRIGFERPDDVLKDPALDNEEKRAALASWASDACAVEGRPAWRRLPGSETVIPLAEILAALQRVEGRNQRGWGGAKK
jgi:hypothetical protein